MSDFCITFLASGLSLNSLADARKENRWCTSWQRVINLILISCVCPYASWLWILSLYFPKLQCFQREVPYFVLWCYLCRQQRRKNPDAAERHGKTHTFTWLTRTSKSLTWAPTELWDVFFLFFSRSRWQGFSSPSVCFLLFFPLFSGEAASPVFLRVTTASVLLFSSDCDSQTGRGSPLGKEEKKNTGSNVISIQSTRLSLSFFNPLSSVFVLDF